MAISRILRGAGYFVVWVSDGEEALSVGLTGEFDAIVLDLVLPRRTGWEVLECLRAAEVVTPVLVLTVRCETEAKVRSLTLGADDHLGKPFDASELVARVGALVRRGRESYLDSALPSDGTSPITGSASGRRRNGVRGDALQWYGPPREKGNHR